MEEKRCLICGDSGQEGLHIAGEYICLQCEKGIIESTVCDKQYDHYRKRLRTLWETRV